MTTAFITHAECLKHDMGAHHPERPARLTAIEDQLIASGVGQHLTRYEAPLATDEQLARVHPLDYVRAIRDAAPQSGTVHLINIFNTVIKTGNNQVIYMPNGPLASSVVINYSVEPTRRMEFNLNISPENDVAAVKKMLQNFIDADPRILADPAPMIAVTAFTEYSLTISMRLWAKREEFWPLNWEMNERIKTAFEENGVKAPAPIQKREVVTLQPDTKS